MILISQITSISITYDNPCPTVTIFGPILHTQMTMDIINYTETQITDHKPQTTNPRNKLLFD